MHYSVYYLPVDGIASPAILKLSFPILKRQIIYISVHIIYNSDWIIPAPPIPIVSPCPYYPDYAI